MGGSAHASFAVGGVVVTGGLYAYFAKKSLPSLYGSLLVGGSIIAGGLFIQNGNDFAGHSISAVASAGLTAVGINRYISTKSFMPAGPLILLGMISTAYNSKKASDWNT